MKIFLKGLWIGGTMTVPGVSGGTMAVVIGIYEKLISSVMELKKRPKENGVFLAKFMIGGLLGFLVFARMVTFLLNQDVWGELIRFLFCGIVAGSIPLLVKQSGQTKVRLGSVIAVISGALIVYGLMLLPAGLFERGNGIQYIFMQLLGGGIAAIALILPGISVSHMLYILGLYEPIMKQVYTLQFLSLIPFIMGGLIGCILTAGVMKYLLEKHTEIIYMVIIGFVSVSLISLLPQQIHYLPLGLIIMAAGALAMYGITRCSSICSCDK